MTRHPHDRAKPETSEAYLKLLRGEISSKDFVRTVEKSVGAPKRASKRSTRRAVAADG